LLLARLHDGQIGNIRTQRLDELQDISSFPHFEFLALRFAFSCIFASEEEQENNVRSCGVPAQISGILWLFSKLDRKASKVLACVSNLLCIVIRQSPLPF